MSHGLLIGEAHTIGRLHVSTLMRHMGIVAIYRRPYLQACAIVIRYGWRFAILWK